MLVLPISMCNNAGTGGPEFAGKVHEMSEKTWDFTMYFAELNPSASLD